MAQLHTVPVTPHQTLEPVSRTLETLDARSQRRARTDYLQKQQQWLNQKQRDYQQDRRKLE